LYYCLWLCVVTRAGYVGAAHLSHCSMWCSCPVAILVCFLVRVASPWHPVVNPIRSKLLKGKFDDTFGRGTSWCVQLLRQVCEAPMNVSVDSLHGRGSYERCGLTLVTTLGGAWGCEGWQPLQWRTRGSTHCFNGISKRRFQRASEL
jgi:hypothetical protein